LHTGFSKKKVYTKTPFWAFIFFIIAVCKITIKYKYFVLVISILSSLLCSCSQTAVQSSKSFGSAKTLQKLITNAALSKILAKTMEQNGKLG
jgi:hypothetical protein